MDTGCCFIIEDGGGSINIRSICDLTSIQTGHYSALLLTQLIDCDSDDDYEKITTRGPTVICSVKIILLYTVLEHSGWNRHLKSTALCLPGILIC